MAAATNCHFKSNFAIRKTILDVVKYKTVQVFWFNAHCRSPQNILQKVTQTVNIIFMQEYFGACFRKARFTMTTFTLKEVNVKTETIPTLQLEREYIAGIPT